MSTFRHATGWLDVLVIGGPYDGQTFKVPHGSAVVVVVDPLTGLIAERYDPSAAVIPEAPAPKVWTLPIEEMAQRRHLPRKFAARWERRH